MSFHVPRSGRLCDHPQLGSCDADGNNGAFLVHSPEPGWQLWLVCSDGAALPAGEAWEHVSVRAGRARAKSRIPTWREMCAVKALCWDDEDVVMQLHPKRSEYINMHPHVLHLWRPVGREIPTPPSILVGVRAAVTAP
jgi:hypothetical protein